MTASKEITYLDVNTMAGYLVELGNLADRHMVQLAPRGVPATLPAELRASGEALQTAVADHLQAQMTTGTEGEALKAARAGVNEWMSLIKDGARLAFRDDKTGYAVVKHDLRIGIAYKTTRVSSVLAEARSMRAGVTKHRAKLLTRLTPEEIDSGTGLVDALCLQAFGRVSALNDQIERKYERTKVYSSGMALARQVLDAADLAFRGADKEPLRELFFGLDERMATHVKSADAGTPTPG